MSLQLDNIIITGRTYGEYCAFFDLQPGELRGKKVLDCPGGASSFTSFAKKDGLKAKAADRVYGLERETLREIGERSIEAIYRDTAWMEGHNYTFYESIPNHRRFREKALREFLKDYNCHDYIKAELPHLPFTDKAFDLVLSSHLFFVYDDRLDLVFHLAAIRELLRVGKEVRIFPLVDFNNSREGQEQNFSPLLYRCLEALQGECEVQIVKVGFEFQRGAGYMLRLVQKM